MAFRGVTSHKVDIKGRMALPTRYRDDLVEQCDGRLVVTMNNVREKCLWLYPLPEWEVIEKKVNALPSFNRQHQQLKRFFVGSAVDLDMDKTGRILLPSELRQFAMIDKEVRLVGQGNKFELWNAADWLQGVDDWAESAGDDAVSEKMMDMQL